MMRSTRRAFAAHAWVAVAVNVAAIAIWASTSGGYFWRRWTQLGLGFAVGLHATLLRVLELPPDWRRGPAKRALAVQFHLSTLFVALLVGVWLTTTRGDFWPAWPALSLALLLVAHACWNASGRLRVEAATEVTRREADDRQTE